jgi:hypothetical protein
MKGTEYGRTAAVQALLVAGADYTVHCSVPITDMTKLLGHFLF